MYCGTGILTFAGTITLNGLGNSDSIFIFRAATSKNLNFNSNTKINRVNSTQSCNVFWVTDANFNVGSNSALNGTFLSDSVTFGANGVINGRILALSSGNSAPNNNAITNCTTTSCIYGRCCELDDSCTIKTLSNCSSNGGIFGGINSVCGSTGQCFKNTTYPFFNCNYDYRNGTCQVWFGYL